MKIIMNLFQNSNYVAYYIYHISEQDRSYLRNKKKEEKDNLYLCCFNTKLHHKYY